MLYSKVSIVGGSSWNTFSAGLVLALLGSGMSSLTSQATIVYSGANQNVVYDQYHSPSTFSLFNSSGQWDDIRLILDAMDLGGGQGSYDFFNGLNVHGNRIDFVYGSSFGNAQRLSYGATIDGSSTYNGNRYLEFSYYDNSFGGGGSIDTGEFRNATGYMGIRMTDGGNTYYGWIQASVTDYDNANIVATLIDWAYEDSPGVAISAGVIPEPSSTAIALMGLFPLCALAKKRRRQ